MIRFATIGFRNGEVPSPTQILRLANWLLTTLCTISDWYIEQRAIGTRKLNCKVYVTGQVKSWQDMKWWPVRIWNLEEEILQTFHFLGPTVLVLAQKTWKLFLISWSIGPTKDRRSNRTPIIRQLRTYHYYILASAGSHASKRYCYNLENFKVELMEAFSHPSFNFNWFIKSNFRSYRFQI